MTKILVCGVGSIGERHIANLLELGYDDITLLRKRNLPLRTVSKEFPVVSSIEEALKLKPDLIFITNPSHLHSKYLLELKSCGAHVFMEKPIACSKEQIETILSEFTDYPASIMVGYMLRFHPLVKKIKEELEGGDLGKVLSYESEWREYLPGWHPWEDYRQSYAAKKTMGGGPALTLSHEIDLMYHLLGVPDFCKASLHRESELELECEHGIEISYFYDNSLKAIINLDYYTNPPKRFTKIKLERGTIEFSYFQNQLRIYSDNKEEIITCDDFDRNEMFKDELIYMFEQIKSRKTVFPNLRDGCTVAQLALDALEDAKL